MKKLSILLISMISVMFGVQAASATIYEYDANPPQANNWVGMGEITNLNFQYNDQANNETLGFGLEMVGNNMDDITGGWFVLSPGHYPAQTGGEFAIMYLDFETNQLTAYAYDPNSGNHSYAATGPNTGLLGTWGGVQSSVSVNADGTETLTASFSGINISDAQDFGDVNGLNNWSGFGFGDEIGIWTHFGIFDFEYCSALDNDPSCDEGIQNATFGAQSLYDAAYLDTNAVSEPAGLALIGVFGMIGFVALRRRIKK